MFHEKLGYTDEIMNVQYTNSENKFHESKYHRNLLLSVSPNANSLVGL